MGSMLKWRAVLSWAGEILDLGVNGTWATSEMAGRPWVVVEAESAEDARRQIERYVASGSWSPR